MLEQLATGPAAEPTSLGTLLHWMFGYIDYYHAARPHSRLDGNSPMGREVEAPSHGPVIAIPQVGGLHHRYTRAA